MRTCLAVSSHLAARHVPAEQDRRGRVAVRRGLRLRQPAHRPARDPRSVRAREGRTARRSRSPARMRSSRRCSATPSTRRSSRATCCSATRPRRWRSPAAATRRRGVRQAQGHGAVAVVTDGPNGAFVRHAGSECHVPAFPCEPVDLTGAGDMFAGAFLYGITHGIAAGEGRARRELPGDEGHHPDRRPAAPRGEAVLGRGSELAREFRS